MVRSLRTNLPRRRPAAARPAVAVAAACAVLLGATACGGGDAEPPAATSSAPPADQGGAAPAPGDVVEPTTDATAPVPEPTTSPRAGRDRSEGTGGTGSGSGGTAAAPACAVGKWAGTGVAMKVPGQGSGKGGAGFKITISRAGAFKAVLTGMKPIKYAQADGSFAGQYLFKGTITGKITLPAASKTKGTWKLRGSKYDGTAARVVITRPARQDLGWTTLEEFAAQAEANGQEFDAKLFLDQKWACSGGTLKLANVDSESTVVWTLRRS